MDRAYIESHDVVARYGKNELTAAEREAFEDYYFEHPDIYFEHPELLEDIETGRLLRAAMRAHDREASPTSLASPRRQVYALAASFLLGVMLASMLLVLLGETDDGVAQIQTAWLIVDRQGGPVEIELATLDQPLALLCRPRPEAGVEMHVGKVHEAQHALPSPPVSRPQRLRVPSPARR